MTSTSDKDILKRLSDGDASAYEYIFDRYYTKVCRFVKSILYDTDAVGDIAQNVFMKIWINRAELPRVNSLDNYLFTIARNEAFDSLRRRSSRSRYEQYTLLDGMEHSDRLSLTYDMEQMERIVEKCVEEMPPQRKLVFRLSREEKLTNQEVADRLQLSKRTVDRHISLALNDIRFALKDIVSLFILFLFSDWV